MKLVNPEPNFSVVLPGGCNARCAFCFWEPLPASPYYLTELEVTIKALPPRFETVSITGGEPTQSVYLRPVLELLKARNWKRVVLTTNGSQLREKLFSLKDVVTHVNLSRHHYDPVKAARIFGYEKGLPSNIRAAASLAKTIGKIEEEGIQTSLVAVLCKDGLQCMTDIQKYLEFAARVGAVGVRFRKPHGKSLQPHPMEKAFSHFYKPVGRASCPVCRTMWQVIGGKWVTWTSSKEETATGSGVYELVFHPDGRLSPYWSRRVACDNRELIRKLVAGETARVRPRRRVSSDSGGSGDSWQRNCGGGGGYGSNC